MVFWSFFCIELYFVCISGSRFFRLQVFLGAGFSGSIFFRVHVFQGVGFSESRSKVRVQNLEVACNNYFIILNLLNTMLFSTNTLRQKLQVVTAVADSDNLFYIFQKFLEIIKKIRQKTHGCTDFAYISLKSIFLFFIKFHVDVVGRVASLVLKYFGIQAFANFNILSHDTCAPFYETVSVIKRYLFFTKPS